MKRFLIILFILSLVFTSLVLGKDMLVRVYVDSYTELIPLKSKTIRYAGARPDEYYDIILTEREYYSDLIPSGLPNEIIYPDLEYAEMVARGSYHSYAEVRQLLKNMSTNYPAICKFDSIGTTHLGKWIYCVKISDNPAVEDPDEPDVLIMGCHHAREWASVEVPLFFADSLTEAYSSNSTIKNAVDSREIWIIPCVNSDGYEYDYPGAHWWRKNRQPYGGAIGTDPNRTYNGCCNGDRYGDWGAIPYYGAVTHKPSSDVFCGPYGDGPGGNSAPCDDAIVRLVKSHEFNYTESFHSYGELVLWPWGYTSSHAPNNSFLVSYGTTMASLIHCVGSGYYDPRQSSSLYPTSGDTDGWIYGWYHYVNGTNCVSLTTELGTEFYQPVSDLDYICRENFKGFFYMVQEAENIRNNLSAEVPAPEIILDDTSTTGDYTIYWSPRNPEHNNPTKWELIELTGFSSSTDNLESGTGFWNLQGFSLSTARYHSSNHSLFSGSSNNISNTATTVYPYPVKSGDVLTFWCWYYLENNFDVATVEVSVDGMEWIQLDNTFTGSQQNWTQKSYSLEPWVGKSVFIRFRAMTDDMVLNEGIYIDDISPVPNFSSEVVVSSNITDTCYTFTSKPDDKYWYNVRGYNSAYGWGSGYSSLKGIGVGGASISEDGKEQKPFSLSISPNPFRDRVEIRYSIGEGAKGIELKIYDVTGRLVKKLGEGKTPNSQFSILNYSWDGRDSKGSKLPAGVYYLILKYGNRIQSKKLILID